MATLDPRTTTRRDFTSSLTSHTPPATADPKYKNFADALKELLTLLVNHEAMARNIDQTYATPAASKNKVYFMWDFVGRTLGMLFSLPVTLPSSTDSTSHIPVNKQMEAWKEVTGRAMFSRMLIMDEGQQLDSMMQISYGDGSGIDPAEFGDDVVNAARRVMDADVGED